MNHVEKYRSSLYKDYLHTRIVKKIGFCLHCGEVLKYKQVNQKLRRNLSVHHVDGCKNNNSLDNITVLCNNCHYNIAHIRLYHTVDNRYGIKTVILNNNIKFKVVSDFETFG
jgi:5-methylcytosine-specific restriction endonuclease McrA